MDTMLDIFADYARSYEARRETDMSIQEFLETCRTDPGAYASAPERILKAIGEPEMVDTAKDARLGRIFLNRTIRVYPAFSEFYGMEDTIERIVSFLRHAAQGLRSEEHTSELQSRQYLVCRLLLEKKTTRRPPDPPPVPTPSAVQPRRPPRP